MNFPILQAKKHEDKLGRAGLDGAQYLCARRDAQDAVTGRDNYDFHGEAAPSVRLDGISNSSWLYSVQYEGHLELIHPSEDAVDSVFPRYGCEREDRGYCLKGTSNSRRVPIC